MLAQAKDALENGWSHEVLVALVQTERERALLESDALSRTMALLERVMDADQTVGGWLMAQLYEMASRECLHEVCDAIDIWMHQAGSRDLAKRFREGALRLQDPDMVRKYEEWA